MTGCFLIKRYGIQSGKPLFPAFKPTLFSPTIEITSTLTYGTLSFTHLTRREIAFLKLVCSELTYHQIAHEMRLSPRTVDG
ncbi:MAG: LuxR C-terminal-related transcriptional regulator, partial [Cytophagaceae bacterium]|nr:LuxR C-terminal-related transcriptional regulator [Cytophagaceae bacterium]